MKKNIVLIDKNDKEVICDVLIEFTFDNNKYIVYTDNTFDNDGLFNLYKAKIDDNNRISDPDDVDVEKIFEKLIIDYKNKVVRGEI